MLAHTGSSTKIIFSKSDKGREEMSKRSHGLSPLQRRVLILIDGTKDLYAIAAMVPAAQLEQVLPFLAQQGFIVPGSDAEKIKTPAGIERGRNGTPFSLAKPSIDSADQQPVPALAPISGGAVAPASAAFTDDPSTIRLVKDFMTTTAQTYLGLLSAPVIQRIEQARTAAQLMAVAGHWNMALRDSQQGKRFASPYLEQVKAALADGGRPVLDQAESAMPVDG